MNTLWRAVKLLKPMRGWIYLYLLLSVVLSVLEGAPLVLGRVLLDFLSPKKPEDGGGLLDGIKLKGLEGKDRLGSWIDTQLHAWFGSGDDYARGLIYTIIVVLLVKAIFDVATAYMEGWISDRLSLDARVRLMKHVLGLDLSFFDKRAIADLTTRIGGDTGMLRKTAKLTLEMLQKPFEIAMWVALALYYNWKLFLIGAVFIPLLVVPIVTLTKKLYKYYSRARNYGTDLDQVMFQCLDGIRTIHAYGAAKAEGDNYERISLKIFKVGMKAVIHRAIQRPLAEIIFMLAGMVVLYYGIQQVRSNEMALGDFIVFAGAIGLSQRPIRALLSTIGELASFLPSAERAFELLDEKSKIMDAPGAVPCPKLEKEIVFENVSFDYGRGWVFQSLNLTVKKGERIGIVGKTGVGKSTLISLLLRFYDTNSGRILIDGVDIKQVQVESLRAQMALVSQTPYHFHTTIAENILYGRPGAREESIKLAAKAAFISDEIEKMPEQYETVVGHSAATLSGGQKQRVAVARAVLRDAPILLLDEATSALDATSEAKVQEALDKLCQGRTAFIVAHRLGTVRSADRIVVFGENGIEAVAPHEQLLEQSPIYKRMWEQQLGKDAA